jgi:hypothetical protein
MAWDSRNISKTVEPADHFGWNSLFSRDFWRWGATLLIEGNGT